MNVKTETSANPQGSKIIRKSASPGPWYISDEPNAFFIYSEPRKRVFEGAIAMVYKDNDGAAQLISAAPELLAALKVCERLADTINFEGCGGHDHCNCQRCCALRSARIAISKAEMGL